MKGLFMVLFLLGGVAVVVVRADSADALETHVLSVARDYEDAIGFTDPEPLGEEYDYRTGSFPDPVCKRIGSTRQVQWQANQRPMLNAEDAAQHLEALGWEVRRFDSDAVVPARIILGNKEAGGFSDHIEVRNFEGHYNIVVTSWEQCDSRVYPTPDESPTWLPVDTFG